ncbi:hypothetical protein HQ529_04875 [Candidatus Woesearchaeota archaeon]|nr:hypothetical protein [Candidatus Woesearchaeota archaeon]
MENKVCKRGHPKVYWQGRDFCPVCAKSDAVFKVKEKLTTDNINGNAPSVFVGHYGYPKLNVGILSPAEKVDDAFLYDAPRIWGSENFEIPRLVDLRSSLLNSRFQINVKESNKFLDITQEVSMASKPVDVEINLKEKPKFRLNLDPFTAPTGPRGTIVKADITSNPKISHKVDKVVDDIDLKAVGGIKYLYKSGFDENFLTKLLSTASMGLKKNRKLVPTKWSITAVDDQVGKLKIQEIKDYNHIDYCAYFGNYLGNYYIIMFFPDAWSYELFETFAPKGYWNETAEIKYTTDYEGYEGRKDYVHETAGGYYAARLPILERLSKLKRQGSVLCLRFITNEYAVHLGVWVVREATRKAMKSTPIFFSDKELMLKYAKVLVKRKFNYDIDNLLRKSILLKQIKEQRKINEFF